MHANIEAPPILQLLVQFYAQMQVKQVLPNLTFIAMT